MTTCIYLTKGTLTGVIESENVADAQAYLTDDDMTQYLEGSLAEAVVHIEWTLHGDGHSYHVQAITNRALTDDELRELAEWVSGQNSDGLGEGFEQQTFAWDEGDSYDDDDDEYEEGGSMISFDWQTNDSTFTLVKSA